MPYKSGEFKVLPDETFESFSGVYNLWSYEYSKEYKEKLYNEYLERGGKPLDEYKNGFISVTVSTKPLNGDEFATSLIVLNCIFYQI